MYVCCCNRVCIRLCVCVRAHLSLSVCVRVFARMRCAVCVRVCDYAQSDSSLTRPPCPRLFTLAEMQGLPYDPL